MDSGAVANSIPEAEWGNPRQSRWRFALRLPSARTLLTTLAGSLALAAVVGVLAWQFRSRLDLTWRLYLLVDRARLLRSMDLKQPEIAFHAVDSVFLTDGKFAERFRQDRAPDVLQVVETDPSVDRRFGAAVLLGRTFGRDRGKVPDLEVRLARAAAADPHPAVRHGLLRVVILTKWSPTEIRTMLAALAKLPLERRAQVVFALANDSRALTERLELLRRPLTEIAEEGEPLQAIHAAALLESVRALADDVSLPNEAFEALSFAGLKPGQRYDFAVAMVRFAPELVREHLRGGTVGSAELLGAVVDGPPGALERIGVDLTFDAALAALAADDRMGIASLHRLLARRPAEIDRVAKFLDSRPGEDRAYMSQRLLEPGAPREPATLSAADRLRFARAVQTASPRVANVAASLWERLEKDTPPWEAAERARFRARFRTCKYETLLETPHLWNRLYRSVVAPGHSADDLAAVEFVIDALGSAPAAVLGDPKFGDRDLFDWYRDHAERSRVVDRFVKVEGACASNEVAAALVAAAAADDDLLHAIAPGVLRRTKVANGVRNTFARASYRILAAGRTPVDAATAAEVWQYWIRTLPAAADKHAKLPSLAEARRLIPPDVARAGVEAVFAETFRPPDPLPEDDWLEGMPGYLRLPIYDCLSTMPEYRSLLARHLESDLTSGNAWRRFRAHRVVTRYAKRTELETATVERLLDDPNTRVAREALLWVDAESGKRLTAGGRAKVRQLCSEATDPGVLAGAVYAIVELPDRNDADLAVVKRYRARTETLVQWAVRYALKNWNRVH